MQLDPPQQVEELSSSTCVISYVISHWKSLPAFTCLVLFLNLFSLLIIYFGRLLKLAITYLGFIPLCALNILKSALMNTKLYDSSDTNSRETERLA